jgi:RNA polymerase sigma-70 factor (ECF subfamily)
VPRQAAIDDHLLGRVKASDMEAFRTLFEHFQPMLFRYVMYRVRDVDLAHDIVQETFVRVWEHRSRILPHLPFFPYVLRISGNLTKDHFKHTAVRARYEDQIPRPEQSVHDDPEMSFQLNTLEREIERVVNDHLAERCRSVFLLSRVEGKSNKEIADILGISVKTVENQIRHALAVLRKRLRLLLPEKDRG